MRTDREELEILRVSLARVAQALGVQTEDKPVIDKSYNELVELAKADRGWNLLCAEMVIFLGERITVDIFDGVAIIETLRAQAASQSNGHQKHGEYLTKLAAEIEADIARRK